MDIEVNDNKQQASFKNGKFYHTFTPTTANQIIKLYHMGCVGDTRLNRIQLEQGTEPTGFVAPKQSTNTISGIFKNLRDLDVMMKDPDGDFWTRIKKTARGTIEEYHTSTLSNEIVRTAEGIVERQTRNINTSVDEKIDGIRTQIDTVMNKRVIALTSESKRYADGISETLTRKIDGVTNSVATVTRNVDGVSSNLSRINSELARTISNVDQKADRISNSVTTLENNSLRKDEVSITSTGIQLGSGKVIDGRTITSLITTQPENIKAITDKFIITPANENLVDFEYRASAISNERDLWLTPKIQDVNLEQGAEFIFDGSVSTQVVNRHDIKFMIEVKTKDGNYRWYQVPIMNANTTRDFLNSNVTLQIPENITNIEYYRLGILQDTRSNFVRTNVTLPKIYKKKSAELIVDGTIEGKHIKSSSIETGHLKAGSVTSNIIAADAIKSKHLQVDDAMIEKLVSNQAFVTELWSQDAFINNLKTIKVTATSIDTEQLKGKTIQGVTIQGGTINGGTITGESIIKIGKHGYMRPAGNGLRFCLPETNDANNGVGVQMLGNYGRGDSPYGLYVYIDPNFDTRDVSETNAYLMTVNGYIKAKGIMNLRTQDIYFNMYNPRKGVHETTLTGVEIGYYNHPDIGLLFGHHGIRKGDVTTYSYRDIYYKYTPEGGSVEYISLYYPLKASSSDIKLKTNITKSTYKGLDIISKLDFKSFEWIKGKELYHKKPTKIGLIAQDVQKIDETLVYMNGDYLALDEFRLLNIALKSIQELQQRIIKLEEQING